MTAKELGDMPYYPQHPCPGIAHGLNYGGHLVDSGSKDPDFHLCAICHGTGLVGGGATLRQAFAMAAMQGQLAVIGGDDWEDDALASNAVRQADALLAALAASGAA